MLDKQVLTQSRQYLENLAKRLVNAGVSADQVTLAGFIIGISVIPLLAMQLYLPAIVAIFLNRLCDGLDGTIARMTTTTDRGAFLDIVLDFLFYSAVPLGFAFAEPSQNALPAAFLIYSFIGTGCSFLAFAIIAEKRQFKSEDYPNKGFYYLGGLAEATETILVFVAMCLLPNAFAVIAYGFATICLISTILRIHAGWRLFQ